MAKVKTIKPAGAETAPTVDAAIQAPSVKVPKRIRMLNELGTPQRAFPRDSVHIVGIHVSEETAKLWIEQGHAEEEDK